MILRSLFFRRKFRYKLSFRLFFRLLLHLHIMPVQKLRDNLKVSFQISFHRSNQTKVYLTVFYNIDSRSLGITFHRIHRIFQILWNLIFRTKRSYCADIRVCIRISGPEYLIHHQCNRITNLIRSPREFYFHHELIAIRTLRNTADIDVTSVFQIVIIRHFQITISQNFHLTVSLQNPDISQCLLSSDTCIIFPVCNRDMPNLPVILSLCNMISSSSYYYAVTRSDRLHLIIFARVSQELSGNQRLEHMSIKLRSDIISLPFFIFRNIICILQITDKFCNLCLFFNCIVFLCLCPQTVCQKLITEINPDVNLLNITMLVDQHFQCFKRRFRIKCNTADHQCLCDLIFTDLLS